MTDTITTRRLDRSDLDGVLELLRAALGEPPMLKRTPELFAWKHFDNPFGESIGLVACSDDRIVGLRAFMRWELSTPEGTTLRCLRAVDTATHPEFERRGIFRRLTEEAVEEAVADDVDMIFNTPNAKSGSGYLSMGWEEVGGIGVVVRPTRRLLWHQPGTGDHIQSPVNTTDLVDRPPVGLRTPRTNHYLTWRFKSHPTARYWEVRANDSVAVLRDNIRRGRAELLIADLFGDHSHKAIRKARELTNAQYLAATFSSRSPERSACRRAGLFSVPGLQSLTLMVRRLKGLDYDVGSMKEWDLALSDLELL
jgi:GNAT superfamily N-acetyltransferase